MGSQVTTLQKTEEDKPISVRSQRSTRSNGSTKSAKSFHLQKVELDEPEKSTTSKVEKSESKDIVKLVFSNGRRKVKIAKLTATSSFMQHRQSNGQLADKIDLREFTPDCVCLLADFIQKDTLNAPVSFYTMAELLKLSKDFGMKKLWRAMEQMLVAAAAKSVADVILALIVAESLNISSGAQKSLHYLAAWKFMEMTKLEEFKMIPFNQFLHIMGSCELNVPNELSSVDAALLWLSGQKNIDVLAPAVFIRIRSSYLSKAEKESIVERTEALNFPEPVTRMLRLMLESPNVNRLCHSQEHSDRRLPRCGLPQETTLPLSKPRPGLTQSWKKRQQRKSCRKQKIRSLVNKEQKYERSSKSCSQEEREKSSQKENNETTSVSATVGP